MSNDSTAAAPLVAIVDDDASVRQSTCRLVRAHGYRTQGFESAEDFLTDGGGGVACVLLDVRMPGLGGLGLQRRLVESRPGLPIVFLTALATEEEERQARAAGAVDVLRKPVAKDTLLRVLRTVLATPTAGGGLVP
ncbi:MAG: response regulator [bacterium]|nr:response regulator [bacterium]